jgi:hypothetical protein
MTVMYTTKKSDGNVIALLAIEGDALNAEGAFNFDKTFK